MHLGRFISESIHSKCANKEAWNLSVERLKDVRVSGSAAIGIILAIAGILYWSLDMLIALILLIIALIMCLCSSIMCIMCFKGASAAEGGTPSAVGEQLPMDEE